MAQYGSNDYYMWGRRHQEVMKRNSTESHIDSSETNQQRVVGNRYRSCQRPDRAGLIQAEVGWHGGSQSNLIVFLCICAPFLAVAMFMMSLESEGSDYFLIALMQIPVCVVANLNVFSGCKSKSVSSKSKHNRNPGPETGLFESWLKVK